MDIEVAFLEGKFAILEGGHQSELGKPVRKALTIERKALKLYPIDYLLFLVMLSS